MQNRKTNVIFLNRYDNMNKFILERTKIKCVSLNIYQLQNRKGCRADPLSEVTRKRLKESPQINWYATIIMYA